MASIVLTDAFFSHNATDLSDWVKQVRINYESEMQDETAMGDTTRVNIGGLKNWSVDVTFINDEAASAVAQTLFSDVGVARTIIVRPTSSAVGATNPNYTGTAILQNLPPIGGAVGDLNTGDVTYVCAGALSRATS